MYQLPLQHTKAWACKQQGQALHITWLLWRQVQLQALRARQQMCLQRNTSSEPLQREQQARILLQASCQDLRLQCCMPQVPLQRLHKPQRRQQQQGQQKQQLK